jgi:hypothetical protein
MPVKEVPKHSLECEAILWNENLSIISEIDPATDEGGSLMVVPNLEQNNSRQLAMNQGPAGTRMLDLVTNLCSSMLKNTMTTDLKVLHLSWKHAELLPYNHSDTMSSSPTLVAYQHMHLTSSLFSLLAAYPMWELQT